MSPSRLLAATAWRSVVQGGRAPLTDALLLALLGLALLARILSQSPIPYLDTQDMGSYRRMAEDPAAYFSGVPPHHAQRILPSLAVWALHQLSGLGVDQGFRLVSALGFAAAHLLLYGLLRRLGVSPLLTVVTAALAASSQWPVDYALRNVWQACDAWTYAFAALMTLLTLGRNWGGLAVAGVAGAFLRQNLIVLCAAALVHLALRGRSAKPLLGLLPVLTAFLLNTHFAGGGAADVLMRHLAGDIVQPPAILRAAIDMDLLWLALPFLPLYLMPQALRHLPGLWWLAAFAGATVLQALLVAHAGGIENTQRLAMPGIWALVPLAGIAAGLILRQPWLQALYALLPATLVISRSLWHGTSFQDWHDLRLLPGIALVGLLLAAWRCTGRPSNDGKSG